MLGLHNTMAQMLSLGRQSAQPSERLPPRQRGEGLRGGSTEAREERGARCGAAKAKDLLGICQDLYGFVRIYKDFQDGDPVLAQLPFAQNSKLPNGNFADSFNRQFF